MLSPSRRYSSLAASSITRPVTPDGRRVKLLWQWRGMVMSWCRPAEHTAADDWLTVWQSIDEQLRSVAMETSINSHSELVKYWLKFYLSVSKWVGRRHVGHAKYAYCRVVSEWPVNCTTHFDRSLTSLHALSAAHCTPCLVQKFTTRTHHSSSRRSIGRHTLQTQTHAKSLVSSCRWFDPIFWD